MPATELIYDGVPKAVTAVGDGQTTIWHSGANDLYNPEKGEYIGIVSSNLHRKTHIMTVGVKAGWSVGLGSKLAGTMNLKSERKY